MLYYLFASLLITSFVILFLGIQSKKGLKRNNFCGVRTKATMRSDDVFMEANREVWYLYIVNAALLFVSSLVSLAGQIFGLGFKIPVITVGVMGVVTLGISLFQVFIANRHARLVTI